MLYRQVCAQPGDVGKWQQAVWANMLCFWCEHLQIVTSVPVLQQEVVNDLTSLLIVHGGYPEKYVISLKVCTSRLVSGVRLET
jgi:hypothetical protein